jgi:hypothetical protein
MKNLFFIKRKKVLAIIALLVGSLYPSAHTLAQATFTSKSSGAWNSATKWTVTGNDADGIPDADDNVVIRATDSMSVSAVAYCKNLVINGKLRNDKPFGIMETVELKTGGILWQNNTIVTNGSSIKINTASQWKGVALPWSTVSTLLIRGTTTTITVDGVLGAVGTNIVGQNIRIFVDATTTTFQGTGAIEIARFQTNPGLSGAELTGFSPASIPVNSVQQTVNIDINMDIENTFSPNIIAFSLDNGNLGVEKIMNIMKGKTVKIVNGNGTFHGLNAATSTTATLPINTLKGGDMTYNIYGTLNVGTAQFNLMTTSNTTVGQGATQKLTVNVKNNTDGTGGKIILSPVVRLFRQLAGQSINVNVEAKGVIDGSAIHLSSVTNAAINANGNLYSWFTLQPGATFKRLLLVSKATPLWIGTSNTSYTPVTLTFTKSAVATVTIANGITPLINSPDFGINKTWNITTSTTTGLTTLNFGYNGTSMGAGNANSRCNPSADMQLLSYNSTLLKWETITTAMATPIAGAGTDKQVTFTGLAIPLSTSFAIGNQNVLIGVLQNVRAAKQAAFNTISWSTASEQNTAYFTVECAKNGTEFVAVGTVQGNGTTNSPHDYFFTDEVILGNTYRVRETKLDGTSTLSSSVDIVQNLAKYYPAVVRNDVRVILPNANMASVKIKNAVGTIVYTTANVVNNQLLNISALGSGTYSIVIDQNGVVTTGDLIKP